eukprot:ANDGO_06211.mRNA.1 Cilia- and flagella-associated protein 45
MVRAYSKPAPSAPTVNAVVLTRDELSKLASFSTAATHASPTLSRSLAPHSESPTNGATTTASSTEDRKSRIRRIDALKHQQQQQQLSQSQPLNHSGELSSSAGALGAAEEAKLANDDAVKRLNQLVLYAQCATIREAQLAEKQSLAEAESRAAAYADTAMELERLKALRLYEERERRRLEERQAGAAVIRAQIDAREKARVLELERKKREQDAMLAHVARMEAEDAALAAQRKEAARTLMVEVGIANAEQMRLKMAARETEAAEELRIAAYLAAKDAREAARAAEVERVRQEKERETARLRAMQEKAQDKAAEKDALRARRAQEEKERAARAREQEESEKRQRQAAEIARAREMQMLERERRLAAVAAAQREEWAARRELEKQTEGAQSEKDREERERLARYNRDLKAQIDETRESRVKARREFMEEGSRIRRVEDEHRAKLESVRAQKLAMLREMGVPEKYTVEIASKPLEKHKLL